jgi:hypothetical protein
MKIINKDELHRVVSVAALREFFEYHTEEGCHYSEAPSRIMARINELSKDDPIEKVRELREWLRSELTTEEEAKSMLGAALIGVHVVIAKLDEAFPEIFNKEQENNMGYATLCVNIDNEKKEVQAPSDCMTGEELRRLLGVPDDHDLWQTMPVDDLIVRGEAYYDTTHGRIGFYTAPKEING